MIGTLLARSLTLLAISAAALTSCHRESDENLGLGERSIYKVRAVAINSLDKPSELLHALSLPGSERDRYLGAHKVEAKSTLRMSMAGSASKEALDETYAFSTDGRGNFALVHDNDHGYGTEARLKDGELFVRPRYGKFIRRRPEAEEPETLRAGVERVAADYVDLLQSGLAIDVAGKGDWQGHPVIALKFSRASKPSRPEVQREIERKWRDSVVVDRIDGAATLDAATGAPLAFKIDAAYHFDREGKQIDVALSYQEKVSPTMEPISVPVDVVESPRRPRPMLDRQQLLEGLAERPASQGADTH